MDRNIRNYVAMLVQSPHASAELKGSAVYPNIHGTVRFYQTMNAVLIAADDSILSSVLYPMMVFEKQSPRRTKSSISCSLRI